MLPLTNRLTIEITRKKALILSDNPSLTHLISTDLSGQMDIQSLDIKEIQAERNIGVQQNQDIDFLVIAMSTPTNNPISALVKAGLDHHIGRIPMLIISNNPYYIDSASEVIRMGFPFQPERLQGSLVEILQGIAN